MKNISALIKGLAFINPVYRPASIKKKKSFMIEALHEVEERLASSTFDTADTEERLKGLKDEFKEVYKSRREAVSRLRDVQTKLKFIARTSEHLRLKQSEIDKGTKKAVTKKEELEARTSVLREEQLLDIDLADIQKKSGSMEQDRNASLEQLKAPESDKKSLTALKENLEQECKSAAGITKTLRETVPELQSKKAGMEQEIESIEELQAKLKDAKEKYNRLNSEMEEITLQTENSRKELDDLKNKQAELQERFMKYQHEKEKLEGEIEEMKGRKDRVDNLNEALEIATAERDEKTNILRGCEARLLTASKEKGELDMELEDIKEKIADSRQERLNMEEAHMPVIDILNKVKNLKDDNGKEESKYNRLSEQTIDKQRDIRTMETELHYYRNALEEIKEVTKVS